MSYLKFSTWHMMFSFDYFHLNLFSFMNHLQLKSLHLDSYLNYKLKW